MLKNYFHYALIALLAMLIVVSVCCLFIINRSPFLREAYCIFWLFFGLFGYIGMALVFNSYKKEDTSPLGLIMVDGQTHFTNPYPEELPEVFLNGIWCSINEDYLVTKEHIVWINGKIPLKVGYDLQILYPQLLAPKQ